MNRSAAVTSMETQQPNFDDKLHQTQNNVVLPEVLKSLPPSLELSKIRHRWNINEEIASWLSSFDKHGDWLSATLKLRPSTGCIFLYNRKRVKYRHDGYVWKKRKEGKSTREDHMKLKVKGEECLYGGYVHSAIVPTFHRRSYWLLQNPDIVLVHYLNDWQPHESKGSGYDSLVFNPALDGKHWTTGELLDQIKPMFEGLKLRVNGTTESISGSASLEALVQYMLDEQAKAGHLTNQVTKDGDGTCSSCSCHSRKTKKKSKKNDGKSHQVFDPSSPVEPKVQPIFTLEPQKPIPPQTKVVPPDVLSRCLGRRDAERQQPSTSGSADARTNYVTTAVTGSVVNATPLTATPLTANTLTDRDALMLRMDNSDVAARQDPFRSDSGNAGPNHRSAPTPGGRYGPAAGRYSPPRVTTEESEELREMVQRDPQLKTATNRFQNTMATPVACLLPNGIFELMQINVMTPGTTSGGQLIPVSQNGGVFQNDGSTISVSGHAGNSTNGIAVPSSLGQQQQSSDTGMVFRTSSQTSMDITPSASAPVALSSHAGMTAGSVVHPRPCHNVSQPAVSTGEMHSPRGLGMSHDNNVQGADQSGLMSPQSDVSSPAMSSHGSLSHGAQSMTLSQQQHHHNHHHDESCIPATNSSHVQSLPSSSSQRRPTDKMQLQQDSDDGPLSDPLDIGFDPYEMLKNTLNLHDLGPEILGRDGIPGGDDDHPFDIMMDIQNSAGQQVRVEQSNKDSGHSSVDSSEECLAGKTEGSSSSSSSTPLVEIADFSPEWSYPEGGIKVLVAGPWNSVAAAYSCVFDNFAVPASLLQPGVLRSFCPAHEKGLVPLHVTINGNVISKTVLFEYKARRAATTSQQESSKQSQQQEKWIELDEKQFQMALLERLEQIEKRLCNISHITQQQCSSGPLYNSHLSFEDRVICICEKLMQISPPSHNVVLRRDQIPRGMTLLHHAAALGYANLIKTLKRWR